MPEPSSQLELLAERLRTAVQGCTLHLHGPVQAFAAVRRAQQAGTIPSIADVGWRAVAMSKQRLAELACEGVLDTDPRVHKEQRTIDFIQALTHLEP